MSYVPEDQRTTAWYLFNKRFQVRIPDQATRSLEEIKQFGVPTTGDPVIDREMSKDWGMRYLCIAEMEDIFNRGYDVKVLRYSETKVIYELISNHLLEFRRFFETVMNNRVPDETIEELIRLDKFAAAVYEPAKHLFTREIAQSILGRHLQERRQSTFLSKSMFNKHVTPAGTETTNENKTMAPGDVEGKPTSDAPERVSMVSMFQRQRTTIGGNSWR